MSIAVMPLCSSCLLLDMIIWS